VRKYYIQVFIKSTNLAVLSVIEERIQIKIGCVLVLALALLWFCKGSSHDMDTIKPR